MQGPENTLAVVLDKADLRDAERSEGALEKYAITTDRMRWRESNHPSPPKSSADRRLFIG